MTMIAFYCRQIVRVRSGNKGQAAVLFLTTSAAIIAVVFATIYTSHLGAEKTASSNAVDTIALSAATWEARGLNTISALNEGILLCLRIIRWICIGWAAMALAACTGVGASAFVAYCEKAPKMIRSYWKCAKQLEEWSMKVKSATPYLVLSETAGLSRKLSVLGALYPLNPKGPHDGDSTLELHLAPGRPLLLLDALGPVSSVLNRIKKWTLLGSLVRTVVSALDRAVRSIIGAGGDQIRMLEPEEDFPKRQYVRFAGAARVNPLPIPYFRWPIPDRFPFTAFAEPYGGKTAEMTWKSRLCERKENR
jgi:hypothetical protein